MKNWLRSFLPLAWLGILGLAYLGQTRIDDDIDRLIFEEKAAARLGAAALANDLAFTVRHLASLTREKPILVTLDAPLPANLARMTDAFTSLILRNPAYDQVRWIDETGMERVRINAVDGHPVAVPRRELQSKADRYYFTDTMRLKPGEIHLSRPDLNVERGQIELPRKPMLRLATPVVDSAGRPRGILVINLLLRRLLDDFVRAVDLAAPHMMLLTQQGAWLRSPDPGDEAEFMRDGSTTFGQRFPTAWARIGKDEAGSFLADDGLWVWRKTNPPIPGAAAKVMAQEPFWTVVSHIPAEDIRAIKLAVWQHLAPAALMGLAILATIGWLKGSGTVRPASPRPAAVVDGGASRRSWALYALAIVLPIAIVLLRQSLPASFGDRPFLLLFVFPITLSALLGGVGPGLVATAVAALGSNYALIPPYGSVRIAAPYDLFQWILLIANGALISVFSEGLRRARHEAERRRLQQAEMTGRLQESETRFRQLAEHTRDIFWVHDWPAGRVSYVSPAFEAITGIPAEDLYRDMRVWPKAIHPEDREWAQLGFRSGVEAGHFNLEYRFIRADGDTRWIEDMGTSLRDSEGRVYRVVGIVRDITERKLAEEELRGSELRMRLAQDAAHAGSWEWILEGNVNHWSEPLWALYGLDPGQYAPSYEAWLASIHPDDREQAEQTVAAAIAHGHEIELQWRVNMPEGEPERWLMSRGRPIAGADGNTERYIGIAIDITERKAGEEALRQSERRFRELFEQSPVAYQSLDIQGRFIDVNPRLCELLGYPREELLGKGFDEVWVENARGGFADEFAEFQRESKIGKELRLLRKDGQPLTVILEGRIQRDPQGRFVRTHCILTDISGRKRMEDELERHRHHLEELVAQRTQQLETAYQWLEQRSAEIADLYNNAPCGYHSLDADGMVVAINDTELAWLGYQREEVVSRLRFSQMLTPDSLRVFNENFPRFKASGQVNNLEFELVRKDGSVLPVSLSATAVRDEDGHYLFSRSTLFDNRERKARDAQIAQLNAELSRRAEDAEAATRAKSAFLANMSHEIRTPMNAVLGFCYLLEQRHLEDEALTLIRKVHHAGRSLLSLINDILDFSKIEAGRLEIEQAPFRLAELLDDLASIMAAAAHDKDLELVITPPVGADALIGDRQRLQQVLINLLGNAIKFTARGEVELRVAVESGDERQVKLRFAVRDTGIGISPDQQAVIFSAFSQADGSIGRRFGGTGLGLAISQQLVRLMGGSLRVESEIGQGSEFWFTLPLLCDQHVAGIPAQLSRLELLVADDSATVRAALSAATNSLGWIADMADSGEAALMRALARAGGGSFYDALLFDWKMPGLDGLEAARTIREALKKRRKPFEEPPIVIMVTAYSRDELLGQPGMSWVDQVLSKPVTPSALYNAVAAALSHRRQGFLPAARPQSGTVHGLRIPGVRVLVVDDSEINQEVAKGILEADGAIVHLACDGQDAVEWLEVQPDAVDIVLMDVQMPRLDGYAATRRIRADGRWQHLPIVALTAGAFQALRDAAEESGMNDFIAKPFNVEQMMEIIQRWTGCQPMEHDGLPPISVPVPVPVPETGLALPGIDLPGALRQWRRPTTYRTYLDKFVESYAQAGETIAAAYRQGDLPAAAALTHKLCGVAGTLWLPQVAELARELETRLNQGGSAIEQAADLQAAIAQVCATVADWKDADGTPSIPEPAAIDGAGDGLVPLFKGLLEALDHNDPDAADAGLARLRGKLDDTQWAGLAALLADFDFRGAEASARRLMRTLNLSITE